MSESLKDDHNLSVPQSDSRVGGLFAGLRVVSFCTLLSRILGLFREIATTAMWGNGPVLDAFVTAFRVPNLARALFGEGALNAAFTPLFVREQEQHGTEPAMRLAGAVFVWLAIYLVALVLLAEAVLALVVWLVPLRDEWRLCLMLTAVMLPYLPLICLTAQTGAVLNAVGRFVWPALLPVVFNICSLGAIWWIQRQALNAEGQSFWLAGFIVLTGVIQLIALWPQLHRCGFRVDRHWMDAKVRVRELVQLMLPVVLALSVTQINTFCDSMIAIGFSRPVAASIDHAVRLTVTGQVTRDSGLEAADAKLQTRSTSTWLPLESGTASALNEGQRLYQFPLGLLGVALGTVIFPLLTRHAERGDWQHLRDDFALGLRLVMVIGIPASAGLWLMSDQLVATIFQRGNFTVHDARQATEMTAAYSLGVWAFCGLLIVQRAYYAIGDRRTPLMIGLRVMLLNLILNIALIFVIGGKGLALSTSLCGILQFGICLSLIQKRIGQLPWWSLLSTSLRAITASCAMMTVGWWVLNYLPGVDRSEQRLLSLTIAMIASLASYALLASVLKLDEFWMLMRRSKRAKNTAQ
ncbi:MAG: murein biosynthesis integral membrane protein MurJ [Planctomycetia bacterium]|nr:murein biosynthesis integral membrane protein MurJ [Planctomycetia bacterium]